MQYNVTELVLKECILCGNRKALIRCLECAPATAVLCASCDEVLHESAPFHDREVWSGTHFIAISPTTSIDEQSLQLKMIGLHRINDIGYMYISMLSCCCIFSNVKTI